MRIDSTTSSGPIGTPVNPVSTPKRVKAPEHQPGFQQTEGLNGALASVFNVRPEAVARAQQLIHDSDYPPAHVIRDISRLLVAAQQGR